MVDNSQGHSAYATDALVVSRMNVNPGGKQALMRDTWFMRNGERVPQTMVYPSNHPTNPNEAKGIKAVLTEQDLEHVQVPKIEKFWEVTSTKQCHQTGWNLKSCHSS